MKRFICICFALCIVLASCQSEKHVLLNDAGFYDEETGVQYVLCSALLSLRPLKAEELFATDGNENYYTIQWQDPSEFLCDYEVEEGAFVYRAEGVEDITFASFEPIAAFVYVEGTASVYLDTFYCSPEFLPDEQKELAGRDDSEVVYAIRDALNGDARVEVADGDISDEDTYYLRMLSAKYPGLYYIIVFFTDNDGNCYLRDRSTGVTVKAPELVKSRMVG